MKAKVMQEKPYAGSPHVRFDEGAGAPRHSGRFALLYKVNCISALFTVMAAVESSAAEIVNPVYPRSFPDPTTWRAPDGTWWASSTALTILASDDFIHWRPTGKRLFTAEEERRIRAKWKHIWAPDAFKMGDE